jgi:ABC-type transport system involved in multi-copper enzyme maturation permease subunit
VIPTLRYELRMMLRKRSMWVIMALVVALIGASSFDQIGDLLREHDARNVLATAVVLVNIFLPVAYGCLLADRLIRDRRLGVEPILDATPVSPTRRLVGKYLGVCAAVATPVAVVYFGFALVYAVTAGGPIALAWAVAAFAAVALPAVLVVGAAALAIPLVVPAPLFRVLFVGYWFWGNAISPTVVPTLAQTVIAPIGDYPLRAMFGFSDAGNELGGPVPGAALNFLRPEATVATACLSIVILLVLAALFLAGAQTLRVRSTR